MRFLLPPTMGFLPYCHVLCCGKAWAKWITFQQNYLSVKNHLLVCTEFFMYRKILQTRGNTAFKNSINHILQLLTFFKDNACQMGIGRIEENCWINYYLHSQAVTFFQKCVAQACLPRQTRNMGEDKAKAGKECLQRSSLVQSTVEETKLWSANEFEF